MTSKLMASADAKVRLMIVGSRIREALTALHELTFDEQVIALEDHEILNLRDVERRLNDELKYLDDVLHDVSKRLAKRSKKVSHA
jgi:hypothetical protein